MLEVFYTGLLVAAVVAAGAVGVLVVWRLFKSQG